jgi:hypothetical protein
VTQKIFLSYAAADKDFVEALKPKLGEFLKAPGTLDVFDSQSDIAPGQDIRKALKAHMDAAGTVVIVASPAGDASQWVNYEAGLADALGKKVVIVNRDSNSTSTLSKRFMDRDQLFDFINPLKGGGFLS